MDYFRRLETEESAKDNLFDEPGPLIATSFLAILLGAAATAAGVGGGGLFVPLYAFVLGTGAKGAVPLSTSTILGGALGKYLMSCQERHPIVDKPLVNYDLASFMQPMIILGTIFGVLLNILLPDIIIVIFLVVILGFSALKTAKKGRRLYLKDKEEEQQEQENQNETNQDEEEGIELKDATQQSSTNGNNNEKPKHEYTQEEIKDMEDDELLALGLRREGSGFGLDDAGDHDGEDEQGDFHANEKELKRLEELDGPVTSRLIARVKEELGNRLKDKDALAHERELVHEEEQSQFPPFPLFILFVMTCLLIIYTLVRESIIGNISGNCDGGHWAWYFMPVPMFCLLSFAIAMKLYKDYIKRLLINFNFHHALVHWSLDVLKKFPVTGFITGLAAGLLGIGGGMVTGPLFLELGINPKESMDTASFMIIFTAVSSTFQFIVTGYLHWSKWLWFIMIGLLSGFLGQYGVKIIVQKTGKDYYLVFLLAGIIIASTLAMVANGIVVIVNSDDLFQFDTAKLNCEDDS